MSSEPDEDLYLEFLNTLSPFHPGQRYDSLSLAADPSLELFYLVAPPRMAYYEKVSRQIYGIYLKYIAPEDIVVYSIDEVFIDATSIRFVE